MKAAMEWNSDGMDRKRIQKHIWDLQKSMPPLREKSNVTPSSSTRLSKFPQISPRAVQMLIHLLESSHAPRKSPKPSPRPLKRHESGPTFLHRPKKRSRKHRDSLAIVSLPSNQSLSPPRRAKISYKTPLRKPGFMQPLVIVRENGGVGPLIHVRNADAMGSRGERRENSQSPKRVETQKHLICAIPKAERRAKGKRDSGDTKERVMG